MYLNQYIEQPETGTLDMIRRCLDAGLAEPEFSVAGGFMATVRRAALAGWNGIRSVVIARRQNAPVAEVALLVLFPDRTWKRDHR